MDFDRMSARLQFSPDILKRLGEELVPDVDQGILELVKNSYDADATNCTLELQSTNNAGGVISVIDNGSGMNESAIRDGWLVIGRSNKQSKGQTKRFSRTPVGAKGLGRLAALRLGGEVELRTRPIDEPGVEYSIKIDWDRFKDASIVEDVALEIKQSYTTEPHGTNVYVRKLRDKIGKANLEKLARSLLLLSDPFKSEIGRNLPEVLEADLRDPGFVASLKTVEFKEIEEKINNSYFDDCEYRIEASLKEDKTACFKIFDWKGDVLWEEVTEKKYQTVPFTFDLWVFVLDGKTFSTRKSTLTEVRNWLNHVGGVHVYEAGIRVPPYGGAENDWLEMNLRRSRSPEYRPSTNTSVGRVVVENSSGQLIQKTDRVGYLENLAFNELKACAGHALDWAAKKFIDKREKEKKEKRAKAESKTNKAKSKLDRALSNTVSVTERKPIQDAIDKYVSTATKEAKVLKDDLQLYRSLATAGMITSVFSHEISKPISFINSAIARIHRRLPQEFLQKVKQPLSDLETSVKRLKTYSSIPLNILEKDKRRGRRLDLLKCVDDIVRLFNDLAENQEISIVFERPQGEALLYGSEALIDGIFVNLISNSIRAFEREGFVIHKRKIVILAEILPGEALVIVKDNAGGIQDIPVEDIWLPGQTTQRNGTGFGLTIVRDSINDLNGSVSVEPKGQFGGAEFSIIIPLVQELL